MADIFDNKILCKDCDKRMEKGYIEKEGFSLRALKCPDCSNKVIHPDDLNYYKEFRSLKKKNFRVKLRFVGNSYAISIPKEIIDFMSEKEKELNNIVNLCFEEFRRLSLRF